MVDEPGVGRGFEAAERSLAHGFGAARDQDIGAAAAYAVGRLRDGLQARAAEAVDGHARHGFGQTGAQQGLARHVIPGFAFGHGAADNDVVDAGALSGLGIARQQSADHGSGEIVRPRVAKSAARGFADGGAETIDDDSFWHGFLFNCMLCSTIHSFLRARIVWGLPLCGAANHGCSQLSAGSRRFYISGVIGPIVGQALSPANRALDQGQARGFATKPTLCHQSGQEQEPTNC